MEQVRSFIAIELPDELKLRLVQLQAQLKSASQTGVKWVDPYSVHLTLKFLGNVALSQTGQVTAAIEDAAKGIAPFRLEVRELGAFPNLRRVQVIWVGVRGEIDKLGQLQQKIEENLAHLGFARESRAFTPHLTLARIRDWVSTEERQLLGQAIANTRTDLSYTFAVDAISLMRSQLTSAGAIYSRISATVLKKYL